MINNIKADTLRHNDIQNLFPTSLIAQRLHFSLGAIAKVLMQNDLKSKEKFGKLTDKNVQLSNDYLVFKKTHIKDNRLPVDLLSEYEKFLKEIKTNLLGIVNILKDIDLNPLTKKGIRIGEDYKMALIDSSFLYGNCEKKLNFLKCAQKSISKLPFAFEIFDLTYGFINGKLVREKIKV